MRGDNAFKQFLIFFTHNVEAALLSHEGEVVENRVEWLKYRVALAMLVLFDNYTQWDVQASEPHTVLSPVLCSIEKVRSLQTEVGLHAAAERSRSVLHIVRTTWDACCASFDWASHYQLLLRGSISQHLMTVRSDIDFEISSRKHPFGCTQLERLVSSILSCLMLHAEGSWARPREQDISTATWSRDVLEWLELRHIDPREEAWPLSALGRNLPIVLQLGKYEVIGLALTPKNVWFAARALLARASARCGCKSVVAMDQLESIYQASGIETSLRCSDLLIAALYAYEIDDQFAASELTNPLEALAKDLQLPTSAFL